MQLARRFSPVLAVIFAFVVAISVFASVAPAAQAHDALATSDPAPDAVLDVAPTQIALTFTGNILGDAGANAIAVTDAAGAAVHTGDLVVDGAVVTQPLSPGLENGTFHVVWRVVSSDGHPISGEYTFELNDPNATPSAAPSTSATPSAEPTASASAEPSAEPTESATNEQPGDQGEGGLGAWGIVGIIAAVLVVVVLVIVIIRSRAQRRQHS